MALYQRAWWKRLFQTKKKEPVDVLKNIQAVIEFLGDNRLETEKLLSDLQKLEELEKERRVAEEGIVQVNLETQAKILDHLLERYQFFQNDADINGIRVKQIASQLLKYAEEAGMADLVSQKKKEMGWKFDW